MSTFAPELQPKDFIYIGMRAGSKGPVVGVIVIDGPMPLVLPEPKYFASDARWKSRSVGGLYRGAKFSATQMLDAQAQYINEAGLAEDRWQWRAEHDAYLTGVKRERLEEKYRKDNDVARMLLPLRKAMQTARKRCDWTEVQALEEYFLRALRKPLDATEQS